MNLLAELRSATRDAHCRLEQALDVPSRCRRERDYADLLSDFRRVYAPVEGAVSGCPATETAVPDWGHRRKLGWLDDDLAVLGRPLPPDGPDLPVTCAEDVVGTVYVLEGATLGGAVLQRIVVATDPALPCRFFRAYGEHRGRMWRTFRRHAERLEQSGARTDLVVAAALRTFAAFESTCVREAA